MKVSKKPSRVRALVRMLSVDRLLPTPDNRRRTITQASVESLAKSLAKDGVLQPIVVRPHPEKDGCFEIRAGERRWRAAKLAGLKEIPAMVRALDDASALSVTIAENLQREGLHPLEEAATIQQAFDRGFDVKTIAGRLGKSVVYIARRASLTKLAEVWRDEVLKAGSEASRLSVAHLELIARLPEETQQSLAADDFSRVFSRGFPTVEELRRLIDGGLQSLRSMPWPLGDETLDPASGSCLNCPKRSGQHPLLFDAEDAPSNGKVSRTDRCLDPSCFERKKLAFLERREAELRAQHPNLRLVQIGFETLSRGVRDRFGERFTQVYHANFVKPTSKRATPAMQIDGPKAGSLVHLDLESSPAHTFGNGKAPRQRDEHGKPVPLSLAERKARLQKRRDTVIVKGVAEKLRSLTEDSLTEIVAGMVKRQDAAAKGFHPLALLLAFGSTVRTERHHDASPWSRYAELQLRTAGVPVVTALHEVVQVWCQRLAGPDPHHVTEQAADARRMCELLGIDFAEYESDAAMAVPTPKSWASLPDDGPKVIEEPPFDPTPASSDAAPPARKPTSRSKRRRKAR
jgi:ParB/RepB/Spo0J family partition protein